MNELKSFLLLIKDVQWVDWKKLVSWPYLTDSAVSTDSPLLALLTFFFIALIITGIIINIILSRKQRSLPIYGRLKNHIFNMTLWLGVIGLFLIFARYQAMYYLSSRILLTSLLLVLALWTVWIIVFPLRQLPINRKKYLERQKFERYLPKRKKLIR